MNESNVLNDPDQSKPVSNPPAPAEAAGRPQPTLSMRVVWQAQREFDKLKVVEVQ
jgi:hypothetical protein